VTSFKDLHRPGDPLLLPNAWDHASAAALAGAGFPAIGTTSLGVAAAAGKPDAAGATLAETLALARLLVHLDAYVTIDLEDGYGDDPGAIADLAAGLAELGVAGVNLEDALGPADRHAAKIAAVKARAPRLFVNARTDTHWLGREQETTLARVQAYAAAGADGIFVPGVTDEAEIAALAAALDTPLNVLFAHTLPRLAQLGVARVSTGSALFRVAVGATVGAAAAIRAGGTLPAGIPSYDEIQRFNSC
jgi:2-methylisocitrate lyase-like PEP mutase family enzyme